MARSKKANNENFFVKFWNGDLSLPMSYWLVGVVFSVVVGFVIGAIVIATGLHEDAMFGFLIPWYIYTTVGIWRSSDKYKGPKFWAILAKIAVIFGVLSGLGQLLTGTY